MYALAGKIVFLTIATRDRLPVFSDPEFAITCIDTLKSQATNDTIGVTAYCFMPDHVHVLASVEGQIGITRFVQQFKRRTTRDSWSHGLTGTLWQRSFHDHVLRESESTRSYVSYILENPVRRGLVKNWWDYPLSGSFTMVLEEPIW